MNELNTELRSALHQKYAVYFLRYPGDMHNIIMLLIQTFLRYTSYILHAISIQLTKTGFIELEINELNTELRSALHQKNMLFIFSGIQVISTILLIYYYYYYYYYNYYYYYYFWPSGGL